MYSESPLASPEDVACYEECVTDEAVRSVSPSAPSKDVPRSSSGRVAKKGTGALKRCVQHQSVRKRHARSCTLACRVGLGCFGRALG